MHTDPNTLTHRECVAVIRAMYPGGCGFDYKRASVAGLRGFLAQAAAAYPDAYAAAAGSIAMLPAPVPPLAVPAPVVPAPVVPAPVAPVVPAPAAPAPVAPSAAPFAPAPVVPAPAPVAPVAPAPAAPAPAGPVNVTTTTARAAFPTVNDWPASFNADACMLRVYHSPDAPDVDPHYVFNGAAVAAACIALAAQCTLPVWCYGEKGTGKTVFVEQLAAALRRPFYRIQCDRNLERAEFVGARTLRAGDSSWSDGTLLQAVRTPGAVVLFDEPTYLQQANVSILNGVLEVRAQRTFRVADTGELVTFAPDVAFFAADNTNGTGDPSGRYVGTGEMNPATLERFVYFLTFDYLPAATEAKVLHARTGAPMKACSGIANVLRAIRAKCDAGVLPDAPSMRRAISFLIAYQHGIPAPDAYEASIVAAAAAESREELRGIFAVAWKVE